MSETTKYRSTFFEERRQELQGITAARRAHMAPQLARFAVHAKEVYYQLRPAAVYADHLAGPHQVHYLQKHGQTVSGPGGVIGDCLVIPLNDHHNLSITHNQAPERSYAWQFRRSVLTTESLSERTTIQEELALKAFSPAESINIDVATFSYKDEGRRSPGHHQNICTELNNYAQAEDYVAAFVADLNHAVRLFA